MVTEVALERRCRMYGIDMGLLWTILAYMFLAVVVAGLSTGLVAWYTDVRKKAGKTIA